MRLRLWNIDSVTMPFCNSIPGVCLLISLVILLAAFSRAKQCESNTECTGVPVYNQSIYVRCVDGQCLCKTDDYCFIYTPEDAYPCTQVQSCNKYSRVTDSCYNTDGYEWRTAFILGLLLSCTGAANFYIGRYDLAVPQLFLLLSAFLIQITLTCCRFWARRKKVDEDGFLCVVCCAALILTILLIVLVLTGITWWIVDAVLIYINQRLDGNGCHLNNPGF